ncbi:hypothetical protein EW145_g2580 [Phellinidium pouzarii]|uniref:PNK3P-domain-containing protein n=1 Tax=Phellinidium pouzarii TaxID=167371 RepID=A0A4S4LAS0_9AGAM|nr:hypothetical protein EW145_g2580 [Phellinidium pouzarii]
MAMAQNLHAVVFPLFDRSSDAAAPVESIGPFHWKKLPFLLTSTCLFGENLAPALRSKIAAFDLDGTVIKWSASKNGTDWEYWNKKVPQVLKEVHDSGYSIVFFSNQCLHDKKLKQWRLKIPSIAKSLPDVPFMIFAATAKDMYRKPMPGMWLAVEKLAKDAGKTIDRPNSFFVGDAAGRKGDFSGTDRKFAENLDLKFSTPEEYFLNKAPQPYTLQGVHVNKLFPGDDNTNKDKKTRQYYLTLAKSLGVPIRSSVELAWHNNLYRALCLPLLSERTTPDTKPERKLVPYLAFSSFAQGYEEPTVEEGFQDVKTVNWVFEGNSHEERFWRMWLQIDGK